MNNYSEGSKIGLTLCSQSYLVGGNWGYLSNEHTDYEKLVSLLQEDKSVIKLLYTSNGVVVIANPTVLNEVIATVEPALVNPEVQKAHASREGLEQHKCLKFFEEIVKGSSSKYGRAYNGFTEYNVGIYSSNDTAKIRLNGIEYPAYKLTIQEMLECLKQLNRFKQVYLKVEMSGMQEFVSLTDLLKDAGSLVSIIKALELSPTGTGVFVTFRV